MEFLITGEETIKSNDTVLYSPEINQIARIAEKFKPDYRKIVLEFVETLKKHQDTYM